MRGDLISGHTGWQVGILASSFEVTFDAGCPHFSPMLWTKKLCCPLGDPLDGFVSVVWVHWCVCSSPSACYFLDSRSKALMKFGFGPWECPCSGMDGGVGLLCLASHRGAQLIWGGSHSTVSSNSWTHSMCSSYRGLPRCWCGVIYPCFTEEEMEARGGCPACVGHTGVVELD